MIVARSTSENVVQPATSARVRKHPRQSPLSRSTMQILTQGVAIIGGGMALPHAPRRRRAQLAEAPPCNWRYNDCKLQLLMSG